MTHPDSFRARSTLSAGGSDHEIFRLDALQSRFDVARLPYTLRILLENLLRREDGETVTATDVEAVAAWDATAEPSSEISFTPGARPAAGLHGRPRHRRPRRDARRDGARSAATRSRINPLIPAELVIDHSVQVDDFASRLAIAPQRRARVPAQPRALRLPALGPGRVRGR